MLCHVIPASSAAALPLSGIDSSMLFNTAKPSNYGIYGCAIKMLNGAVAGTLTGRGFRL